MKKTLLTFFLFSTTTAVFAQAESKLPEILEVKETVYDFGKIAQGKPVYHEFEIANIGILPLKIDNVAASCGCTTPEWSKESIATGGRTRIKVGYNAAAEGFFEKEITIHYNGNQTKQIRIKGNVWKAPVGAAPSNASIQLLKSQFQ